MRLKVLSSSSKANGYLLYNDEEALLIETGCKLLDVERTLNFDIELLKGIVVSHSHQDHAGRIVEYSKTGIPIYTGLGQAQEIFEKYGVKTNIVNELKPFKIGNFTCVGFNVPHENTPNFGYIIGHEDFGKLMFYTDCKLVPYNFNCWNIKHIIAETNYDVDVIKNEDYNFQHKIMGHCSLQTSEKIINAHKTDYLKNIFLAHLGSFSNKEYFKKRIQDNFHCNTLICESGLDIEL